LDQLEKLRAIVASTVLPDVTLKLADAKAILSYIASLETNNTELLSEQRKLKKDLRQTQYLSVLWVRILDSYVPQEMKQEAMKTLSAGIAEGMKQAGIEEYEAHLEQLEQSPDAE